MADTEYLIKPRPPIRAFVTAAVASIAGALLTVFAQQLDWGGILVAVGGLLLVAGVVLAIAGLVAMRRQQMVLRLTGTGYELSGSQGVASGDWDRVTRITQSEDGRRFTIFEGEDVRRHLVFSPGATTQVDQLLADLAQRLDHAKGYRDL